MKKILTPINLLFFLLIIIILILKPYTDDIGIKNNKNRFKFEKCLIVKDIIKRKGYFLICKNPKNNNEFEINPSDELLDNINIGDTVHKLPNSNICVVKNKRKEITVTCYPDEIVDSSKDSNTTN